MKPLISFAIAVSLLGLLAYGLLTETDDSKSALEGSPAPEISDTTLDGATLKLSSFKGKPTVINFWASWCDPCRQEAPLLAQLAQNTQVQVFGVLIRDKTDPAKTFAREFGYTFPTFVDALYTTAFNYGVTRPPETFFIDSNGIIVKRHLGALTVETLKANLAKIGVAL